MRTCPSCKLVNPDGSDFCDNCGEYLNWDEPSDDAAEDATATVEPPGGAQEGSGVPLQPVLIVLRSPDGASSAGAVVTCRAAPGGDARVAALIRNQSQIVDTYDLSLDGLPRGWGTVTPPTVYLLPLGARSAGGFEQEVEIRLAPPRAPEAEARAWPFDVLAVSRSNAALNGSAPGCLLVEPFRALESEIRPRRAAGRTSAHFQVTVSNRGNVPMVIHLAGEDDEEAVRFNFRRSRITLGPGAEEEIDLTVGADPLTDAAHERPFSVRACTDDLVSASDAVFMQVREVAETSAEFDRRSLEHRERAGKGKKPKDAKSKKHKKHPDARHPEGPADPPTAEQGTTHRGDAVEATADEADPKQRGDSQADEQPQVALEAAQQQDRAVVAQPASVTPGGTRACPACGAANGSTAAVCVTCGARLTAITPSGPSPPSRVAAAQPAAPAMTMGAVRNHPGAGAVIRLALNVIWLVLGGLWLALAYAVGALAMFILIITIPFGIAALRIARFCLWPFGRTVIRRPDAGAASFIGNVIWLVLAGWWLALSHLVSGVAMCLTIIGIPLGLANFKLIRVSLTPFGRDIVTLEQARRLGMTTDVSLTNR